MSKKSRRLRVVTIALLHMVECASTEKYCSGCNLAEEVLRQNKKMDRLLRIGDVLWTPNKNEEAP